MSLISNKITKVFLFPVSDDLKVIFLLADELVWEN